MDETPPPLPTPQPKPASLPRMSLFARLLNVFAVPGQVFEDVRNAPTSFSNWLIPIVLATIVGAATVSVLSQPGLIQDFRESQVKVYAERVAAGKMTEADAQQNRQMLDWITQPAVLKVGGTIFFLGFSVARVLWWGLLLWWLGRTFLKVRFSLMKSIEVAGLATMITVLGSLMVLLLILNYGGNTGGGLTVAQLEAASRTTVRVVLANVFSIWFVGVLAAGLARLAEVPFVRTMLVVLGAWIALQVLIVLIGGALLGAVG
jgi:hypothetical protein